MATQHKKETASDDGAEVDVKEQMGRVTIDSYADCM